MSRAALCVLGFGLLMSGCMTPKATSGPLTAATADPFPAPDAAQAVARRDYRIAPGDSISVTVFQVPELNRTGQVDAAGNFFLAQVGEVAVAGKTSQEAAAAFDAALSPRFVLNPQVTVDVKATNLEQFTIEGGVIAPGLYDIGDDTTLMKAIAIAKGTAPGSDVRQVVVFRVIEGQKWAQIYDLANIRAGKAVDPRIYAGDMVTIPTNSKYDTLKNIIAGVPLFALFRQF